MSLFGSRQDDPLLQDDPFAPSFENNNPSAPDTDAPPEEREDSVFSRPKAPASGDGSPRHRIVHRSRADAEEGRLHNLNAAFDAGWRLDRVELQPDASFTLSFVLHRRDADSSQRRA